MYTIVLATCIHISAINHLCSESSLPPGSRHVAESLYYMKKYIATATPMFSHLKQRSTVVETSYQCLCTSVSSPLLILTMSLFLLKTRTKCAFKVSSTSVLTNTWKDNVNLAVTFHPLCVMQLWCLAANWTTLKEIIKALINIVKRL